ncbi:mucin-5AC [Saccopteryx leptura]|uniref:mucin-5AC n=1 Tax=Saccopteryx leptura TaxID=249018 RepID=UPI00339D13CB
MEEKYAQHWCSRLTDPQGPFAECHAAVNPASYYSNCLFDTCNCEKSEDCLCAALSSYVRACAARGVLLRGWRAGVCAKPMETCPKSMTYHYNIGTCQPTCQALNQEDVACGVSFVPVDGCTCPQGTFLDNAGKCVPAASCPCYHGDSVIPNGESLHERGAVCTCTQGTLTCIGGQDPAPVCAPPMVYFDCRNATPGDPGAGCQKSCHTLDMDCGPQAGLALVGTCGDVHAGGSQEEPRSRVASALCPALRADCYSPQCVPGCVCPDGLVADGEGGCIAAADCPCVHNEASYQAGQTIRVGCNTCTCKSRMWQCTDEPCLATCAVYGDGHYLTFDGQRYSFNGDCEYTLVQDHCGGNGSAQDAFRVVTENVPCGTTGTTCSKAIKIFLGSYELKLSDGKVEVIEKGAGREAPYSIRQVGIYLVVDTEAGLVLLWDKKTSIFLRLSPEFKGKVCGLCGNFDNNAINDFTTRSQSVVGDALEFGNSWKVSPSCPDALAPRDPCIANPYRKSWAQKQCSLINSATFEACHAHVEPAKYYEACVNDACACDSGGDCECFCTAVAAYAQACREVGVCVPWRSPEVCRCGSAGSRQRAWPLSEFPVPAALFCDYYNPEGQCEWHYQPCGAPCLRTCRNPRGQCLHDTRSLEGCYPKCPPAAPIFDEDDMQCVATCPSPPPPPPCQVHGKSYRPGAVVPSDKNCHSCICTENGVQCVYDAEACVCTYDGRRFRPGEVIYHTTDGSGGCISARCGVNGTVERSVHACSSSTPTPPTTFSFSTLPVAGSSTGPPSTPPGPTTSPAPTSTETRALSTSPGTSPRLKPSTASISPSPGCEEECQWSSWLDVSHPGRGVDSGDFDTLDNLRAHGYLVCQEPRAVECQAEDAPGTPLQVLGQRVECSPTAGLVCYNRDQASGLCDNYQIRVLCCTRRACPTSSGPTPATPPATDRTTQARVTPRTTSVLTESSTASPAPVTTTGPTTSSTMSRTPAPGTPTPAPGTPTPAPGTPTPAPGTPTPAPGTPTPPPGTPTPPPGTPTPPPGTPTPAPGTPTPPPGTPSPAPGTPTPAPGTPTPPPGTPSPAPGTPTPAPGTSATVRKTLSTSGPMPVSSVTTSASTTAPGPSEVPGAPTSSGASPVSCLQEWCTWTGWIDASYPGSGINSGDFDTFQNLRSKGYTFCERPSQVECRAQRFPDTPLALLGQDVVCNNQVGLVCLNRNQLPPICYNYQIRIQCCEWVDVCKDRTVPSVTPTGTHSTRTQVTRTTGIASASTQHRGASSTQVPPATKAVTPGTRAVTPPGTTTCRPQCTWTKWFDVDFPSPGPHGGDLETYSNIVRSGEKICLRPESIARLECRAESHPEVSIERLGQVVQCSPEVGLVCHNRDQPGRFQMCLNYEVRVLCCEPQEGCPTTKLFTVPSTLSVSISGPTEATSRTTSVPETSTTSVHRIHTTSAPETSTTSVHRIHTTSAPETSTTSVRRIHTTSAPETSTTSVHRIHTTSAPETSTTSVHRIHTSAPETSTTSVHRIHTTSAPETSTTSVHRIHTSAPETSTTSVHRIHTTSAPETSTTSVHRIHTTSAPETSTTSVHRIHTSAPETSTTSVHRIHTSAPETSMTSVHRIHTSAPETSTTSVHRIHTSAPETSTTSVHRIHTSAPETSTTSVHRIHTSAPETSTTSVHRIHTSAPETSTTSVHRIHTTSVPETSTSSAPLTTTTPVPAAETTHLTSGTTTCQPQCTWTKWFDVDFPSPGPHGGDLETYSNIVRSGEKICLRPESIARLECRAESHPEVSIERLGQVVQCNPEVGLVCHNRDQPGRFQMCLNYEVRVLCCEPRDGCPTSEIPYETSSTTRPPTTESSSVAPALSSPSPATPSAPACYCSVSDKLYPAGSVIYQQADLDGHCYYAVCSVDCHVVRQTGPACPTSTAPPTPATSPAGSLTSTPVLVTTQGCPNAVPPRTRGETWAMPNCSQATCEGNNVITLQPRPCPPVQEPTCANGYPALKVADQDGCCLHYQCQCVCSGWGDPHYITFDGTYYTFLDNCTYLLVQQIVPVYGHFRVLIDNYFCDAEDGLSCPQSIIVEYRQDRVVLTRKPVRGVMTNEIIFNNKVVSPGFGKDGILVSQIGIKMYVTIPEIGVQVLFTGLVFSVTVPFSKFANNTEGQCGTCTNDPKDDCRLPGGAVVTSCSDMSMHWKVTNPDQPSCHGPPPTLPAVGTTTPPVPCPPSPICQLILSDVFKLCHAVIPPRPYFQGCVFDQCHMTNEDVVCSGLELYASLCASHGVCVDWRGQTNHTCPFTCPADKVYRPCGPTTPSYCYGSDSVSLMAFRDAGPVTEGCFCPEGMTPFSATTDVCVPLGCPMCLGPHGEPVEPGHTVSFDCQECTCEGGSRAMSCRPQPCPPPPACPEPGLVPVPAAPQAGQCCPQYTCACNTSYCPTLVGCPEGTRQSLTYEDGACCPRQHCSWTVCSVNGTLYQPGAVVSSSLCETCRCELPGGPPSDTFRVSCETQTCSTHCPVGFEYQAQSGQCCGACVQVACVMNTSDSSAHLFYPGESWSDPGNRCEMHECERHQNGLVVVTTKKACPPLSCPVDQAVLSEDRCCLTCPQPPPQNRSTCAVYHKHQVIRVQGCSSEGPVRLTYCRGNCGDTTSMYSLEANSLEHQCRCCQELRTSPRDVTLRCADGSRRAFSYTQVEECGCVGQHCEAQGHLGQLQEQAALESQDTEERWPWGAGARASPLA